MSAENGSSMARRPAKTGKMIRAGLLGRCPRCAEGRLFKSYLKISERCDVCGLGFSDHDVGDGPVVPAILVLGGIIVGLALWLELEFQPPLWLHMVLWGPLLVAAALKEKVGGAGFKGATEMPLDMLEEAEQQLERSALDFTTWALDYVAKLGALCKQALEVKAEGGARAKTFEEINLLALELRGQGGTFGYPLISTFGKMLYDATVEGCREDDNAVEIVKAHIDAMGAVLREKVAGDGGEVGRTLLTSLKKAIESKEAVVK